MQRLREYVGTTWRYTAKGAARTGDPNRVFVVVDVVSDQGRDYLLAWKCELLPDGRRVSHPAYRRTLLLGDERLYVQHGSNGSKPTAMFRPDSLYRQIEGV